MVSIFKKYHNYLVGLAKSESPVGRSVEVSTQFAPWIAPLFVGGVVCSVIDPGVHLGESKRLAILIPFAIISMIGMAYVGGVMLFYGAQADLSRRNRKQKGD